MLFVDKMNHKNFCFCVLSQEAVAKLLQICSSLGNRVVVLIAVQLGFIEHVTAYAKFLRSV